MSDLLALTVRQPFGSAVILGAKPIENRDGVFFDVGPKGRWIALHAAKAWYPSFDPKRSTSRRADIRNDHADAVDWLDDMWPSRPALDEMPLGSILGMVHVRRVWDFRRSTDLTLAVRRLGPWATGPVCIEVDQAVALPSPIPCKGALGLWRVPEQHVAALTALVPA